MRITVAVAALAGSALLRWNAFALTSQEIQLAVAEGAAATDESQVPEMIALGSTPLKGSAESTYHFAAGSCWQAVRNWSFKRAAKGSKLDPEVARSSCFGRDILQVSVGPNESTSHPAGSTQANQPDSFKLVTTIRLRIGKTIVNPVESHNDSGARIAVFDAAAVMNAKGVTILATIGSGSTLERKIEQVELARIFHLPSE